MSSDEKSFRLRIETQLYDDLERMADEERRSVNNQILIILERAVQQWKASRSQHEPQA